MIEPQRTPLAWVESPLQLLGAAEYAAHLGRPISVAFRLTGDQMPATAQELLDRGALFSTIAPYYGIPWDLLRAQRDWVIGDGFSGQFRLAAAVVRPRSIALLDDGDMTRHLAAALLGQVEFARRGQRERRLTSMLGGLARDRMLRLASTERLTMFSAYADDPVVAALAGREVDVVPNAFAWLRSHTRPVSLPHPRVVLGSANVTDGLLAEPDYLDWVTGLAARAPVSYLPHRRERDRDLAAVARVPGVTIVRTGLPAELALAGTSRDLEVLSRGSSASTTLRRVLAGTGSVVRVVGSTPAPAPSPAPRSGTRVPR